MNKNKSIELDNINVLNLKKSVKINYTIAGKPWVIVISYDRKATYTFEGESALGITWTHRPVMFIQYEANGSTLPFSHLLIHELTHAYYNHAYLNLSVVDEPSEYIAQFNGNFLLNIYNDSVRINNKAIDLITKAETPKKKKGK